MRVESLSIPGLLLVRPVRHGDARGWFSETYRADVLSAAGLPGFVQDNQSFSAQQGTLRGLHFQTPPVAQAKLVRVLMGAILDVVVDLRAGSAHFGQHLALRLDAESGMQLYVPEGFAHGFCTLVPDTTLAYKVSAYYSREHDRSLRWNDPELRIEWPVGADEAVLSDKDRAAPLLRELGQPFA